MSFAARYGPWALVAGASDGVGAAFAEGLAERGVNVVLLARRQDVLDRVAARIRAGTSAQTRTLAIDLAHPGATKAIAAATADVTIGMLVYCAGADPDFKPFLPIGSKPPRRWCSATAWCPCTCVTTTPRPWSSGRRRHRPVRFRRRAGRRAQHGRLRRLQGIRHGLRRGAVGRTARQGVDVLGLILGKTDTPALRALEYSRGQIASPDQAPSDAAAVSDVIAEAFENLGNGPTLMVGDTMRAAAQLLASLSRNQAVELFAQAAAAAMGPDD